MTEPVLNLFGELTPEQVAEFRQRWEEVMTSGGQARVMPPEPVLTAAELRYLLRECATVVKPGETLILRVAGFTPEQVERYQEVLDACLAVRGDPFAALVVHADDVAVAPGQVAPAT